MSNKRLFKKLFSFSQKEVKSSFDNAQFQAQTQGLKLLFATNLNLPSPCEHGKLLIITPRKSGKAHQRNLLRRRVKSIYYEEKLYKNPVTAILLVYNQAQKLTYEQIKKFLISHIKI